MGGSSSTPEQAQTQTTASVTGTRVSLQVDPDRPRSAGSPEARPRSAGSPEAAKSSNARPNSSGSNRSNRSNGSKDSKVAYTRQETTKVGIGLRCEALHRACRSFVVVYAKTPEDKGWTEYGRTSVVDTTKYPNYEEVINVPFYMEIVQLVRLEVYRVRDEMGDAHLPLEDQAFLGSAEVHLMEAIRARNEGTGRGDDGWLKAPLNSLRHNCRSSICLWAEEDGSSKSIVSWRMKAKSLRSTDFWKGAVDPYVLLYRIDTEAMHSLMPELKAAEYFGPRASQGSAGDTDRAMPSLEDLTLLGPKERKLVLKSSIVRKRRSPTWPDRSEVSIQNLCSADSDHAILADVYDWYKLGDDQLIGSGITTFPEIYKSFMKSTATTLNLEIPLMSKKAIARTKQKDDPQTREKGLLAITENVIRKPAGQLQLYDVNVLRSYTFVDYVRGGLELKLIVAVDCTRSNGKVLDPCSPHYLEGKEMNNYAATIQAAGEVFKFYADGDDWYPMYGFGAKIPPTNTICSDCFALTGDWFMPEVRGVDGLVEGYRHGMRAVRFHGPTHLRRVVEVAADWSRPFEDVHTPNDNGVDMKYFVLLVLSDGGIDDQKHVTDTILESMDLPLSIILVDLGIGRGENQRLKDLNKEVEWMAEFRDLTVRDMMHCVRLDDFWGKPKELTAAALSKLPQHVLQYYKKKDVNPRGLEKFEDERGAPVTRRKITEPASGHEKPRSSMAVRKSMIESGGRSASASKDGRHASASKDSNVSEGVDALATIKKKREEAEAHLAKLPPFLRETRNNALEAAQHLGYDPKSILRVLRDGVADDTMAIFMDNMVHCGYGKSPTFKDLVAEAAKAEKASPLDAIHWHQPPDAASMLQGHYKSEGSQGHYKSEGSHAVSEFRPMDVDAEPPSPHQAFPRPPSSAPRRTNMVPVEAAPLPGAITEQAGINETCTVCFEAPLEVEFVPCGHRVACEQCAHRLGKLCPLCRTFVTGYKKIRHQHS